MANEVGFQGAATSLLSPGNDKPDKKRYVKLDVCSLSKFVECDLSARRGINIDAGHNEGSHPTTAPPKSMCVFIVVNPGCADICR